jgi:PilZ domain-containing protein
MNSTDRKNWQAARSGTRIHTLDELSVHYEGHTEEIAARPPDISPHGMFINTSRRFPEGAVLNLRFRLGLSGAEIEARGEVRYCLEGVGVGVEFVGLPPEAARAIEEEIKLCASRSFGRKYVRKRKLARSS